MTEESDVVKLHVVEGGDASQLRSNEKVLRCLRTALAEAEEREFSEVCIVMSTPFEGSMTSMAIEEGDEEGLGRGSIYSLIGAFSMAEKFLREVGAQNSDTIEGT